MAGPGDRVRVLWLINGLGRGGAERLLHAHARVGDHDRFDYEVAYLLRRKSALTGDLEQAGVRVHRLDARRRTDAAAFLRLRRLLRGGGYDVVHVHSPLVGAVARAVVRGMPAETRPVLVSTEHNEWTSFRLPTRVLNGALFRDDAAHWAVSPDVRASIWPSRRDHVEVLVHGIVLDDVQRDDAVRAEVRAELGAGPDDVVVGTVANYRPQKAYPDLLRAARDVLDADRRVLFVAVGQGPLEADVRQLHAKLGLGDRFLHLGQRDDVIRLLSGWDVFTLASHYEGFPVSVMEALAAGLPLVVTDVGGIRGTVLDDIHGRVVPPGAPAALSAAVLDLAANAEARRRMGAASRELGRRFDVRNAVARIEEVYLELAPSRRRARVVDHVT